MIQLPTIPLSRSTMTQSQVNWEPSQIRYTNQLYDNVPIGPFGACVSTAARLPLQASVITTFPSNLTALFLVEEIVLAKCNTVQLPYLVVPRGSQADLNKAKSLLAGLKRIWSWSLQLFCICSMQSPAEPDNRATGFRGSLRGFCAFDLNKTISYQFEMTMCWLSCGIRPTGSSRQCSDLLGLESCVRSLCVVPSS